LVEVSSLPTPTLTPHVVVVNPSVFRKIVKSPLCFFVNSYLITKDF